MSDLFASNLKFFACSYCHKQLQLDSSFSEFVGGKEELLQNLFDAASSGIVDHPLCDTCFKAASLKSTKLSEEIQEETTQYEQAAANLKSFVSKASLGLLDQELQEVCNVYYFRC